MGRRPTLTTWPLRIEFLPAVCVFCGALVTCGAQRTSSLVSNREGTVWTHKLYIADGGGAVLAGWARRTRCLLSC